MHLFQCHGARQVGQGAGALHLGGQRAAEHFIWGGGGQLTTGASSSGGQGGRAAADHWGVFIWGPGGRGAAARSCGLSGV
ncbi:unnamed protein product [Boreogadus saida]